MRYLSWFVIYYWAGLMVYHPGRMLKQLVDARGGIIKPLLWPVYGPRDLWRAYYRERQLEKAQDLISRLTESTFGEAPQQWKQWTTPDTPWPAGTTWPNKSTNTTNTTYSQHHYTSYNYYPFGQLPSNSSSSSSSSSSS